MICPAINPSSVPSDLFSKGIAPFHLSVCPLLSTESHFSLQRSDLLYIYVFLVSHCYDQRFTVYANKRSPYSTVITQ